VYGLTLSASAPGNGLLPFFFLFFLFICYNDGMRLSKEMIQHISGAIATNLETKGMVEYDAPKPAIVDMIAEVITRNMLEEDKLNKDVEKMLAAHEAEIAKGNMDYRKVFELTKQKLAQERGFVL
jgi:hypothetical protein